MENTIKTSEATVKRAGLGASFRVPPQERKMADLSVLAFSSIVGAVARRGGNLQNSFDKSKYQHVPFGEHVGGVTFADVLLGDSQIFGLGCLSATSGPATKT